MRMGGLVLSAGGRVQTANQTMSVAITAPAEYPQPSAAAACSIPACPEIDCLRDRLPAGIIAAAELRAAEVGVGADRALIAADIISEEAYVAALCAREGLTFEPLHDIPRDAIPRADDELLDAAAYGILPAMIDGRQQFVIAPNGFAAR